MEKVVVGATKSGGKGKGRRKRGRRLRKGASTSSANNNANSIIEENQSVVMVVDGGSEGEDEDSSAQQSILNNNSCGSGAASNSRAKRVNRRTANTTTALKKNIIVAYTDRQTRSKSYSSSFILDGEIDTPFPNNNHSLLEIKDKQSNTTGESNTSSKVKLSIESATTINNNQSSKVESSHNCLGELNQAPRVNFNVKKETFCERGENNNSNCISSNSVDVDEGECFKCISPTSGGDGGGGIVQRVNIAFSSSGGGGSAAVIGTEARNLGIQNQSQKKHLPNLEPKESDSLDLELNSSPPSPTSTITYQESQRQFLKSIRAKIKERQDTFVPLLLTSQAGGGGSGLDALNPPLCAGNVVATASTAYKSNNSAQVTQNKRKKLIHSPGSVPNVIDKKTTTSLAPMLLMNNLPYMGELTFDTRPRRGRKPKKADICHLISKNYGIHFPNSYTNVPNTGRGLESFPVNPPSSKLKSNKINKPAAINFPRSWSIAPQNHSSQPPPDLLPITKRIGPALKSLNKTASTLRPSPSSRDNFKYSSVATNIIGLAPNINHNVEQPLNLCVRDRDTNDNLNLSSGNNNIFEEFQLGLNNTKRHKVAGNFNSGQAVHCKSKSDSTNTVNNLVNNHNTNDGSVGRKPSSSRKRTSTTTNQPHHQEKSSGGSQGNVTPHDSHMGGSLFGQADTGGSTTAQVSICKFKFTGGAKPSLQEKKMLSVDSGGNFRFYTDKSSPSSSSGVKGGRCQTPSFTPSSAASSISAIQDNSGSGRGGGEQYAFSSLPKSAKSMSVCMPVRETTPTNPTCSSFASTSKGSLASLTLTHRSPIPAELYRMSYHHGDVSSEDSCSSSQSESGVGAGASSTFFNPDELDGGGVSASSTNIIGGEGVRDTRGGARRRRSSSSKRKRRTRKSVMREKLEKTFKEKGFLIQTQQLESAEGATYCKFRQLRKFTRYLFRSWKDYLPDNVKGIQQQQQNTQGVDLGIGLSPPGAREIGGNTSSNGVKETIDLVSMDMEEGVEDDDEDAIVASISSGVEEETHQNRHYDDDKEDDAEEDDEDEALMMPPEVSLITGPSSPVTEQEEDHDDGDNNNNDDNEIHTDDDLQVQHVRQAI